MKKTITRTAEVRHFPGLRVLRVYPYGNRRDAYEIDLDRCRDYRELVGWLRHLSGKTWITGDLLADVMDAWGTATGKPVHHW